MKSITKSGSIKAQFECLFGTIHEGAILVDRDGVVIKVNQAAENMIGRKALDLLGNRFDASDWMVCRPDGTMVSLHKLFNLGVVKEIGQISDMIVGISPSKNCLHWIRVNSSKILNKLGRFEGVAIILEDITEKKYILDEQKRLKEYVGKIENLERLVCFARKVTHDFNNQFACAMGYADILSEELGDNKKLNTYAEKISSSIEKATSLSFKLQNAIK